MRKRYMAPFKSQIEIESLAAAFRHFAEVECRHSSPLYEALSFRIAEDSVLLELASNASPGQPVPNLLFGAVHYLLLQVNDGSLAQYYPGLTQNPLLPELAYAAFRTFCLWQRDQIVSLLSTHRVQTNEVGRCS